MMSADNVDCQFDIMLSVDSVSRQVYTSCSVMPYLQQNDDDDDVWPCGMGANTQLALSFVRPTMSCRPLYQSANVIGRHC